ncbi:MAG: spermidine synthase, partial [Chloroflexota bacterium]
MLILYTATIFTGSALLFLVQPMFGRMLLPLLGSSPTVWNTALVLYQGGLLAGYGYAHLTTTWRGVRRQAALHVVLLALPLLALPIDLPAGWTPPAREWPIPWLLATMLVSVGLPFFVVATSSPLLQRWFAGTGHPAAADPYFLYAASNLGSLLALLSYPLLLEPRLGLTAQSQLWSAGYGLLALLTLACGLALWRAHGELAATPSRRSQVPSPKSQVTNRRLRTWDLGLGTWWRRRLRWLLLAAAPSSLLLSVTAHISSDIAAVPLLWVIPLAIYLLTFVLVFARRPLLSHRLMVRALPFVLLPLVVALAVRATQPILPLMALHLAGLFVVSMVCHGEVAADRPPSHYLTEFYFWLALGGVLGGAFSALAAPLLFNTVAEYPLALVVACLAGYRHHDAPDDRDDRGERRTTAGRRERVLDVGLPLALGALAAGLLLRGREGGLTTSAVGIALVFGPVALICLSFRRRPLRFGLAIAAILLASAQFYVDRGDVLLVERSFFGVHRVRRATLEPDTSYHVLVHGTTVHGLQSLDPSRRQEPLLYYHSSGPVGQIFRALGPGDAARPVAVVGLGAGGLACYGAPGQRWYFYEIDPEVERIARDPQYFTFLRDCPPDVQVILGDARLSLTEAPPGAYHLIVLDAYSSDAIPIHLITREALAIYLDKLAAGGVLAFHISTRHLDLAPVLGRLARDAGLVCLVQEDTA